MSGTDGQKKDAQTGGGAWRSVGSRTRLIVMLLGGLAAGVITGLVGSWGYAPLVGWDVAALVFTVWVWLTIRPMSSAATASHATREDPGHAATDLMVIIASVASLAAVGFVLIQASSAKGGQQSLLAGLGLASVALSWFTVHTLFMLRYARLYYTGKDGGVNFNQDAAPRYLDFGYLAFTIGMTFQVSDTDLETPAIRHTALRHALLSYLFGAVILASTINLIAGLGTGSGGGGG
ncbi:MAG: DUF1345 domain-containing protein [Actinomycetota bacterium]|nr:DUF1345 domain-containing protein [Actinomycetota bacterium]